MPVTNPQEIRLNRQDDIEAIIGNPPGWTLRWGMTVLFFCMVLLLTISWFVSYPDIVEAPAVLTTENPPIRLMAGASAKIISLRTSSSSAFRRLTRVRTSAGVIFADASCATDEHEATEQPRLRRSGTFFLARGCFVEEEERPFLLGHCCPLLDARTEAEMIRFMS